MLCKQWISVRVWEEALAFCQNTKLTDWLFDKFSPWIQMISIYSSMDRVSGFDPDGVGSSPTKCLFYFKIL